jgi:hypothetical protein
VKARRSALQLGGRRRLTLVDPLYRLPPAPPQGPTGPDHPAAANLAIPLRPDADEIPRRETVLFVEDRALVAPRQEPAELDRRKRGSWRLVSAPWAARPVIRLSQPRDPSCIAGDTVSRISALCTTAFMDIAEADSMATAITEPVITPA